MANEHEVGFGKPPKDTQFEKGRSGNPKGRPKGSRNFSTDVKSALRTPVRIKSGGRPRTVSTQEALLLLLLEKALNGDVRAIDRLLGLARDYNDEELKAAFTKSLEAEDREVMKNHEARLRRRTNASGPRRKASAKKKKP